MRSLQDGNLIALLICSWHSKLLRGHGEIKLKDLFRRWDESFKYHGHWTQIRFIYTPVDWVDLQDTSGKIHIVTEILCFVQTNIYYFLSSSILSLLKKQCYINFLTEVQKGGLYSKFKSIFNFWDFKILIQLRERNVPIDIHSGVAKLMAVPFLVHS